MERLLEFERHAPRSRAAADLAGEEVADWRLRKQLRYGPIGMRAVLTYGRRMRPEPFVRPVQDGGRTAFLKVSGKGGIEMEPIAVHPDMTLGTLQRALVLREGMDMALTEIRALESMTDGNLNIIIQTIAGEVVLEGLGGGHTIDCLKHEFFLTHIRGLPRPRHYFRDGDFVASDWSLFHRRSADVRDLWIEQTWNRDLSRLDEPPAQLMIRQSLEGHRRAQERGAYAGAIAREEA